MNRRHFLDVTDLDPMKIPTPAEAHKALRALRNQVLLDDSGNRVVVGKGQEILLDHLIGSILIGGHCLLEGPPGVNKTQLAKRLANHLSLVVNHIQCTPDIVPTDLVWTTTVTSDDSGERLCVNERPGKLFSNIVIMDEINRASPKTHSATLEAMSSRQATPPTGRSMCLRPKEPYDEAELLRNVTNPYYGMQSKIDPQFVKGQCFVVIATQNPLEHEGVFPLAQAQQDRFTYKCHVDHLPLEDYVEVARHAFDLDENDSSSREINEDTMNQHVRTLYFLNSVRQQMLGPKARVHWNNDIGLRPLVEKLVFLTHLSRDNGFSKGHKMIEKKLSQWSQDPQLFKLSRTINSLRESENFPQVRSGSSVRGYLAIIRSAYAQMLLSDRAQDMHNWTDFLPSKRDVARVAPLCLRHRLNFAPGARASGITPDKIIDELLDILEIR